MCFIWGRKISRLIGTVKCLTFFVAATSQNSFCCSVLLQQKCTGSTFSCIQAYIVADTLVTLMLVWLNLKGSKFMVFYDAAAGRPQGCVLSPLLFVFLLWKLRNCRWLILSRDSAAMIPITFQRWNTVLIGLNYFRTSRWQKPRKR